MITHDFIRKKLGLADNIKVKLNGTFSRNLDLLDLDYSLYRVIFKIQTALWTDSNGIKHYVSIFPVYIKKYYTLCLHAIEHIAISLNDNSDIFTCIKDPYNLLTCEDRLINIVNRFEKLCTSKYFSSMLNSRYVEIYNRSLPLITVNFSKRFQQLYCFILTARLYFGKQLGVLTLANSILIT